ncbi:cell wall-binding repeat-containing protein [Thermococcus sp. GR6]|uniref:cell wall-binding repeat-containing protein n=1 Tax=Thermococcus sp. GR6 TaxID=1638256 RepID=UPI001430AC1C|nr:hypothetical protein [Thermococcus sp. GR6]NJE42062.1 hypothetical protein [Thermococcus sp. GR6]
MMWKKAIALLFGFMLITTTLSFGRVSAEETSVTVILVSDNEADCALAQYLANVTGAIIVTTTWGVYDPNVAAEIMSYAPDEVIIIGGPEAVVEQYVNDIQELGITVERWGGQNRYETNLMVMTQAQVKFKLKFKDKLIMVPGNDTAGIKAALRIAVRERAMIAFVNGTTNVTRLMLKLQVRTGNVTIVGTPFMNRTMLRVREQLRNQSRECNCTSIHVNITAEIALEAINASEERINTAKALLENATLTPMQERLVERMLTLAEKELSEAKEAYSEGKYGKAYGMAIAAKAHAEFVIRIASSEWSMRMGLNPMMRANVTLHRLEAQIKVLENAGIDVSELKNLVEQLKVAIQNNDVEMVNVLLMKIEESLRELFMGGKSHLKAHAMPFARGGAP